MPNARRSWPTQRRRSRRSGPSAPGRATRPRTAPVRTPRPGSRPVPRRGGRGGRRPRSSWRPAMASVADRPVVSFVYSVNDSSPSAARSIARQRFVTAVHHVTPARVDVVDLGDDKPRGPPADPRPRSSGRCSRVSVGQDRREVVGRGDHGDPGGAPPVDVPDDHRQQRDRHDADDQQEPYPGRTSASGSGRSPRDARRTPCARSCSCPHLRGAASVRSSRSSSPDALDEDLLERRIGDLEAERLRRRGRLLRGGRSADPCPASTWSSTKSRPGRVTRTWGRTAATRAHRRLRWRLGRPGGRSSA